VINYKNNCYKVKIRSILNSRKAKMIKSHKRLEAIKLDEDKDNCFFMFKTIQKRFIERKLR